MTSEAVVAFSIRRFEATENRNAYFSVTTKNALGRTDTKQVPADVFENGGGVRAAAETELKTTLAQAQGLYNDLHDTLADLNKQAREATQTFEKGVRRLFGVRIGGEVQSEEGDVSGTGNVRIVTPTPDTEAEEEPVTT